MALVGVSVGIRGMSAQSYLARLADYCHLYDVRVDGQVWTFTGGTERARIEFSPDGRKQTINWEWRPKDVWLPLCDRTANRVG